MQVNLLRPAAVLVFSGALAFCAIVPERVPDRFAPAPLEKQRIEGMLGERLRVNLVCRLLLEKKKKHENSNTTKKCINTSRLSISRHVNRKLIRATQDQRRLNVYR